MSGELYEGEEQPAGARQPQKRKISGRTTKACLACRSLKIRCIGPEDPPCKRCADLGLSCAFVPRSNAAQHDHTSDNRSWQQRVEGQLEAIRRELQSLERSSVTSRLSKAPSTPGFGDDASTGQSAYSPSAEQQTVQSFLENHSLFLQSSLLPVQATPLLIATVKRLGGQSDEGLASSLLIALENATGSTQEEDTANCIAYFLLAFRSNWSVPVVRRSSYLDLATASMREHTHPGLQHLLLTCEIETSIILCRPTREASGTALPDSDTVSDAYIVAYSGLSVIIDTFMHQLSRHRQSLASLINGVWPKDKQPLYINEKRALLNSKFDLMAWEEKHKGSSMQPWQRYTLTMYARAISVLSEAVEDEKGCDTSLQAQHQHIQSDPDMLAAVMTGLPSSLPARLVLMAVGLAAVTLTPMSCNALRSFIQALNLDKAPSMTDKARRPLIRRLLDACAIPNAREAPASIVQSPQATSDAFTPWLSMLSNLDFVQTAPESSPGGTSTSNGTITTGHSRSDSVTTYPLQPIGCYPTAPVGADQRFANDELSFLDQYQPANTWPPSFLFPIDTSMAAYQGT